MNPGSRLARFEVAGSQVSDGTSDWVLLASVIKPQGRRGEVLADIHTDFPHSLSTRKRVFLRRPAGSQAETLRQTRIESQWLHKGRVVLKFVDVDSITEAEKLRGYEVVIPREERLPLEDDAVYISDLIGVSVVDVHPGSDGIAGEIIDVEPEGAVPPMLVIRTPAGEERLVPFVRAYLRKIDLEARRMEMDLPAGLLEMQSPTTAPEQLKAGEDQESDS